MTQEEAIKEEKNFAEKCYKSANFHHTNKSVHMEGVCRELAEYHEQVAKWLEELQELKRLKEQIWSLDDAREDFLYDVYKTLEFLPTNDEANRIIDSFDRVTSGIRQELCDDCISRVDALSDKGLGMFHYYEDYARMRNYLKALPPVTPQPKTKRCKWIRYDHRTICPQNHDVDNPYWRIPEKRMDVLKYCPYCGKEIEV